MKTKPRELLEKEAKLLEYYNDVVHYLRDVYKRQVNIAYEAATADLKDVNMIDSFHLEAYGEMAVNYNRDLEVFPVVKRIIEKITGAAEYQSPTDMGVNRAGFCIYDDEAVREAAVQEIIRRFIIATVSYTHLFTNCVFSV